MIANKAYEFRMYPTKEQEILIIKTFGCSRFIYNTMLADKIVHYEKTKEMLNNTPAQYKQEFEWLKEVDSFALCNAQLNLQSAFKRFFGHISEFPNFKKKGAKANYTTNNVNNNIRIDNGKIRLPKLNFVKIKQHRVIPDNQKIKSATIKRTRSGKYFVSVLVEYEQEIPVRSLNKDKALGLDYSSSSFYVDNQDRKANYPKFFRKAQDTLAREQRKLSHMVFNSKNYQKQKLKVARVHEHIANQRKDWIHKLSTALANECDYIFVENISMQEIAEPFALEDRIIKLGKATCDNGFGIFREFLSYKMKDRGKQLIKIDRSFPSSKTCRFCGYVNKDLKLSDRTWTCKCGRTLDRDENAAKNILSVGLSLV